MAYDISVTKHGVFFPSKILAENGGEHIFDVKLTAAMDNGTIIGRSDGWATNEFWMIIASGHNPGLIFQVAIHSNRASFAMRTFNGSTWSSWGWLWNSWYHDGILDLYSNGFNVSNFNEVKFFMALYLNGTQIGQPKYNGNNLSAVYYNGVKVWPDWTQVPIGVISAWFTDVSSSGTDGYGHYLESYSANYDRLSMRSANMIDMTGKTKIRVICQKPLSADISWSGAVGYFTVDISQDAGRIHEIYGGGPYELYSGLWSSGTHGGYSTYTTNNYNTTYTIEVPIFPATGL